MNSLVNIIKDAIHDNENIQKVKCRSVMKRIKQLVKKKWFKKFTLMSKNSFYYISKFIPFKNTVVAQSLSGIGTWTPCRYQSISLGA